MAEMLIEPGFFLAHRQVGRYEGDHPELAKLKLLVLVTDAFGGRGGIAKFNRDFLLALDASPGVERVCALPRLLPGPIGEVPGSIVYDRQAARGKLAFMRRALVHALFDDRMDFIICGHLHLLPAAWLISRFHRAPLALVIHGIEAWLPSKSPLANHLAHRVDQIIAVSRLSAERFASWSGLHMRNVFVLPNCVDLGQFQPRGADATLLTQYGLQRSKVLLTMGRLVSEERAKGFDEVINVMPQLLQRFPNLKYVIVGDGPDLPRLRHRARAAGVSEAVIFAGYVPESEKAAHYSIADVYVMPSSGEGFGIVLIEAAACGIPVIGSLADGSREALLDGRLGKLVDPRKPHELLEALTNVLKEPRSHRRIDAIETFSLEKFRGRVTEWVSVQARTLDRRKVRPLAAR